MKPLLQALLAVALVPLSLVTVGCQQPLFRRGERVLFQGDSITDMARGRTADPNHILGHSYVFLIAAKQGAAYPEQAVTFINRGVGGNEVGNLATRWDADAIDLKPDVLSILIGVNDVGHSLRKNEPVSIETYEKIYDELLAKTVAASFFLIKAKMPSLSSLYILAPQPRSIRFLKTILASWNTCTLSVGQVMEYSSPRRQ